MPWMQRHLKTPRHMPHVRRVTSGGHKKQLPLLALTCLSLYWPTKRVLGSGDAFCGDAIVKCRYTYLQQNGATL